MPPSARAARCGASPRTTSGIAAYNLPGKRLKNVAEPNVHNSSGERLKNVAEVHSYVMLLQVDAAQWPKGAASFVTGVSRIIPISTHGAHDVQGARACRRTTRVESHFDVSPIIRAPE